MTVYGVFYTPDFNEQLRSLHMTKELADKTVREVCGVKEFDLASGYESEEEQFNDRLETNRVEVRLVEISE